MKAAVYHAPKQPHTIEDVEIDHPKGSEVLVRIMASGVCHSDHVIWSGHRAVFAPPMILGHEVAGVVEEVGPKVTSVKPGDHVIAGGGLRFCGHCKNCRSNRAFMCLNKFSSNRGPDEKPGLTWQGKKIRGIGGDAVGFAQMSLADELSLVKIDDDLPMDRMALIGCGVTTGLGAVLRTAKVPPGATVAVIGTGGVGSSAIQGARIAGAGQIIAVDVVDSKLESSRKFGATDTVNAAKVNAVEAIRDLTDGGVEYSFEAIGNVKTIEQAILCLMPRGTATLIGVTPDADELKVNAYFVISGERRVQGHHLIYSVGALDQRYIVGLYRRGLLNLDDMVSRHGKLEELDIAFRAMEKGEVVRTVLLPN
jgi:S-(hydroxymethyl)glutathione dehydrogenase / alcohol dehydrogenase